jgi:hypothetical protein
MAEEERAPSVPKPTLLDQLGALITRLDPLIAYIAETEGRREAVDKEILAVLKNIEAVLGEEKPPIVVSAERIPVVRAVTIPSEPLDVRIKPTPLPVAPPKHRNYLSEEETVVKGQPKEIKVTVELGRDGEYGYIVSDKGTIRVRINGGEQIPLFKGQAIYFHELNLQVSRLDISTESMVPLAYRLLVV